ncbi:MAG: hypothetical protein AAF809_09900 [Bacteroidota bacterium]
MVALRGLQRDLRPYLSDWACELLESGIDSLHVRMAAAHLHDDTTSKLEELFDGAASEIGLQLWESEERAALALLREHCRLFLSGKFSREAFLATAVDLYYDFQDNSVLWQFYLAADAFADHEFIEGGRLAAEGLLREAVDSLQSGNAE